MSFYVYILQSEKDQSFYIGQTNDLLERLRRHNHGLEKYTSKKVPWKLFWKTEVPSRSDAMRLEKRLKNLKSTKRMMEFISRLEVGPAA
ncbi:MAG TPA: GIY-YIG nuclease family protein [Cyclobacteriaceae bacterium]|nr:GIY-YIG nuclease family protein [Cyclobacteriaceae bacterium]